MKPRLLLGVDGGGTKTGFVLLDTAGTIVASHRESGSYHLQIGLDGLRDVLRRGLESLLAQAGVDSHAVHHAFFGLPAHGEDSALQPLLDSLPESLLGHRRYRCGNDMLCTWAGALAGEDGIGIVAGTGAIGYGERGGVSARSSGWGELFGDEGSAYWVAVQGLNAFSRMADGRMPRGPLYSIVMDTFELRHELDLCARVMGPGAVERDRIASYSTLVARAAREGDRAAQRIFEAAADELSQVAGSLRSRLGYGPQETVPVSYSGGLFESGELLLAPLSERLRVRSAEFDLRTPVLPPAIGAAVYAARDCGQPLSSAAIDRLRAGLRPSID